MDTKIPRHTHLRRKRNTQKQHNKKQVNAPPYGERSRKKYRKFPVYAPTHTHKHTNARACVGVLGANEKDTHTHIHINTNKHSHTSSHAHIYTIPTIL